MKLIGDIGIFKKEKWKRGERYGVFFCPVCKRKSAKIMKDGLKANSCSHRCYALTRSKRGPYKKKIINKKYLYLYMPEHPFAIGTKKLYVAEHRKIVEDKIGRYLNKNEVVHHKNGDTMDNRIENLQLMTSSEHTKLHKNKAKRGKNGKFKI